MRFAVPCPQAAAVIKEQRRVVQGAIVAFGYRAGREPDAEIARTCGERRAPGPVQGFRRTGRVAAQRTPVETARPQLRQDDEVRAAPGQVPAQANRGGEVLACLSWLGQPLGDADHDIVTHSAHPQLRSRAVRG